MLAMGPGSQLAFLFISKMFSGLQVWRLCTLVKFFYSELFFIEISFYAQGCCHNKAKMVPPQTVDTKLESHNSLECDCML